MVRGSASRMGDNGGAQLESGRLFNSRSMWLMASRWVSCTTCVYTSMVMLIWEWPRISITTRGAIPAAVRRVAVPCRASWSRMTRRPADWATRVKER